MKRSRDPVGPIIDRRAFGRRLLAGAGVSIAAGNAQAIADLESAPGGQILPPPDARMKTTACAFCIVACGYKVYTWPVGRMGGPKARENAFGVDFPVAALSGYWVSPQMHNVVSVDGAPHHVIVLPDPEATVVNLKGNHGVGGSLARKLYNPQTPTADRLLYPQLRVDGILRRIDWDAATEIVARVGRHTLDTRGELAWGMKTYSYQFYENTYAITKLAFDAVGTPCWAPHDSPLVNSDVPGLSDAGIDNFSAAYQDWKDAEVIYVSGVSLHEAHGILFDDWVRAGGAKLIVVDPRRGPTADYAMASGGLFLQIRPGTDTLLHNAIAKIILDNGWHDIEWIRRWTGTDADLPQKASDNWRRYRFALSFDAYQAFIREGEWHQLERAAEICGLSPEQIYEAAVLMAKPKAGRHPLTSLMLEKGNYWAFNYPNTASFASLGLLVGAGNRPGRMISRAGGHQRGMIKGGSYPLGKSPARLGGYPAGLDLDQHAKAGNLGFVWVIGCTWASGGTADAQALYGNLERQARQTAPQLRGAEVAPGGLRDGVLDVEAVIARLNERVDNGGLVFVQQDIYPHKEGLTELADLVLPAATWGEGRFSRMNGERRLRIYTKFMDAPGECREDWDIVAEVARQMGYAGFDWTDTAELFIEAGLRSGGAQAYGELITWAQDNGVEPMDHAERLGTTGIQCPVKRDGDHLEGTVRLHEEGFKTKSGRALFLRGDWADVIEQRPRLAPREGEMWVLNRRVSNTWSAMIEDQRVPYRVSQLPANPILINPYDAERLGLRDAQAVRVVRERPFGQFEGVLEVTDRIGRGVLSAYFNFCGKGRYAANNVTSAEGDPISGKLPFKLGRGRVEAL